MYNPTSLEEERLSWRAVIYYNITRPIRRIFEALDAFGDSDDDDEHDAIPSRIIASTSDLTQLSPELVASSSSSPPILPSAEEAQLASLRSRLAPLLAAESSLAERLSGGLDVSGSGKGNVFVRSGWQARSLGLSFGRSRSRGDSLNGSRPSISGQRSSFDRSNGAKDVLIEEVARLVDQSKEDIQELWHHPAVRRLRARRKLRLEEWAELYVMEFVSLPASEC